MDLTSFNKIACVKKTKTRNYTKRNKMKEMIEIQKLQTKIKNKISFLLKTRRYQYSSDIFSYILDFSYRY